MSARILVVDDNPLNVKLLAAKLARDYYVVNTAENGARALQLAMVDHPDLILLDIMMPDMDGFEVCRRLKADPSTRHIPVVMVTALSDSADRVRGLECGADDFLTKPINDVALMARVRSLLRLKMLMDEWRLRESTAAHFALPTLPEPQENGVAGSQILLLEDNPNDLQTLERILESGHLVVTHAENAVEALQTGQTGAFDLMMVSLDLKHEDGLQLCARLRAHEATRMLPILLIANEGEIDRVAKGLDLGANDYLLRPLDGNEMIARVRTQLLQKQHYDRLRSNYERSLAMALVDPLTGAYNRRYLDTHFPKMVTRYRLMGRPLSVLSFDLDHFKQINDAHGHAAGDAVLKEFVTRLTQSLRAMDLVVRLGGEEFAVVMPETDLSAALAIAERLRQAVVADSIPVTGTATALSITTSVGVATSREDHRDSPADILKRADTALYRAKTAGRNMVVGEAQEELAHA